MGRGVAEPSLFPGAGGGACGAWPVAHACRVCARCVLPFPRDVSGLGGPCKPAGTTLASGVCFPCLVMIIHIYLLTAYYVAGSVLSDGRVLNLLKGSGSLRCRAL